MCNKGNSPPFKEGKLTRFEQGGILRTYHMFAFPLIFLTFGENICFAIQLNFTRSHFICHIHFHKEALQVIGPSIL